MRDSLPKAVVQQMREEKRDRQRRLAETSAQNEGRLPAGELESWREFQRKQAHKLDLLLDEGLGECLLRQRENREPLIEALHYFEGTRVEMLAYTIMPNHAHLLCRPLPGHELETLTASWKRHSSQTINRRLGRTGPLWQDESWDRLIRDAAHYTTAVRYIAQNPIRAKLRESEASVWLHPSMRGEG